MSFANKNNVDYLIGGNVRSSGKRIRISVDLTDASDGSILWGEKYDRVIEDIFDLQDEIVLKMSRQLLGNIEISSLQRIKRKPSENLNSYEWLIRGTYHHVRSGKENNLKAIDSFEQAIKLDSSNARAHALKACTIGGGLGKNFYEDNEKKWNELLYHVDKSLEADENDFKKQGLGYDPVVKRWRRIKPGDDLSGHHHHRGEFASPGQPCPVCTSPLKKVHNATLYGGAVAIGFRCGICAYLTGHRWREPSRYSFRLKGGK